MSLLTIKTIGTLKTIASLALGLSVAASSIGCITYDRVGPVFAPSAAPAEGYALVYVYRPTKAWGALHAYVVTREERIFVLYAGAYGVLVVPEGKATFFGGGKPLEFEASRAKPVYVRAAFDSLVDSWDLSKGLIWEAKQVSEAEALSDLADIGLAPGGRGRYPEGADAPPPTPSAPVAVPTPTVPAPPAPTATPVAAPAEDTIYLKDGTTVVGDIIDEDAKAVSIMLKDGHGRVVPKTTIERVARRPKK